MTNRHRHAIEQAPRRWRGGARRWTRRKILISTQVVEAFGASKAENGEYLTAETMTKLMEAFCARRACSRLSVKAPWLPTRSGPGEAAG